MAYLIANKNITGGKNTDVFPALSGIYDNSYVCSFITAINFSL